MDTICLATRADSERKHCAHVATRYTNDGQIVAVRRCCLCGAQTETTIGNTNNGTGLIGVCETFGKVSP